MRTNAGFSSLAIGSKITLSAGRITVDFDVTFNDSGTTMKTSVPFTRR